MGSGMGWEVRWADLVLSVAGIIGAVMARGFRVEDRKPRPAFAWSGASGRTYARGEISRDEYLKKKRDLEN